MSRSSPYQPLLLRILHNFNALLVLSALLTGFLVYNAFDGRFGQIPLPRIQDIIGIHGTIALCFFLFVPAFALYSFHAGQHRLIQPNSIQNLAQVGRPIWWVSLHRIVNTLLLLAATLAAITGRMMQESWLPSGELNHPAYLGHLIAWLLLLLGVAIHLLMIAKVGGVPLLLAMLDVKYRPEDSPAGWLPRLQNWLRGSPHISPVGKKTYRGKSPRTPRTRGLGLIDAIY
jgi:hypothetical protein